MGLYEQSVELARDHERKAERARDRFTAEYFGDMPRRPLLPVMDSPISPEEPQTLNEWLEAMDPDEFYQDHADFLLSYSPGQDPTERQMRDASEQLREWLAFAADYLEAYGTRDTPSFKAVACLITELLLQSARNYKEKPQ
jgi:hypothetical protein